jgi:hypothetical protein
MRITVQSQQGQIVLVTLYWKKKSSQNRTGRIAQVVEHLPSKQKALSSSYKKKSHFIPSSLAKVNKPIKTKCWQICTEHKFPLQTGKCKLITPLWRTLWEYHRQTPPGSTTPLFSMQPRAGIHKHDPQTKSGHICFYQQNVSKANFCASVYILCVTDFIL